MKKPRKNVDLIIVIGLLIVLAVTVYLMFNPQGGLGL
jgi:uncharacterized membrane protein